MKNVFLTYRFFLLFGAVVFLFLLSFSLKFLFPVAQLALGAGIIIVVADAVLLFRASTSVTCQRILPKLLSLGDQNKVHLILHNHSEQPLQLLVIDELPFQFQKRDFEIRLKFEAGEERNINYSIKPLERGGYEFGVVNIYAESFLGLLKRRYIQAEPEEVPVYPSVLQMKQYALKSFDRIASQQGLRKMRRIGHSYEFEQIKPYVRGDDYRSINWKATARRGSTLMVNQYEDERAQQVYAILDKSRVMKMPFEGLSLLNYAINTALVISNIILRKNDKAGLLTFSNKMGSVIKADRKAGQLNKILHTLYKEEERPYEANYELLFYAIRKLIKRRSLLLLYTNFESQYALERVLPVLRRINKLHLLVVVFFENTEVADFAKRTSQSTEEIYYQTIARKFVSEKEQMVYQLRQYGIQSILTRPEQLSIQTINKYLELKARGLI